jgi:hypothetical protein
MITVLSLLFINLHGVVSGHSTQVYTLFAYRAYRIVYLQEPANYSPYDTFTERKVIDIFCWYKRYPSSIEGRLWFPSPIRELYSFTDSFENIFPHITQWLNDTKANLHCGSQMSLQPATWLSAISFSPKAVNVTLRLGTAVLNSTFVRAASLLDWITVRDVTI